MLATIKVMKGECKVTSSLSTLAVGLVIVLFPIGYLTYINTVVTNMNIVSINIYLRSFVFWRTIFYINRVNSLLYLFFIGDTVAQVFFGYTLMQ